MPKATINTLEEAISFLNKVKKQAEKRTQKEVAKLLEMSEPGFNNALVKASALAGEAIPLFKNFMSKDEQGGETAVVRSSGRGGQARTLKFPTGFFEENNIPVETEFGVAIKKNGDILLSYIKS